MYFMLDRCDILCYSNDMPDTVADLIRPFRTQALAEATGRTRGTVSLWRAGRGLPDVAALPGLATLLGIELDTLTRVVAAEANGRRRA
jgi:transcriptional regulator with XRE-family HTH domain